MAIQDGPGAPQPSALLSKLDAVATQLVRARDDRRLADLDHAREAMIRSELTRALCDALVARAQSLADLRARTLALHRASSPRLERRRNRLSRRIDRWLQRAGPIGHAAIIARSGLWRVDGAGLRPRLGALRNMLRYAMRRGDPAAQPDVLLDEAWYLEANPGVAGKRGGALVHYLIDGRLEDRAPGPLFDPAFYRASQAGELARTGLSPFEHFVLSGAADGVDPHPLFSVAHYLALIPGLAGAGVNPLDHYLRDGAAAGLSPHPLFDVDWYRGQLEPQEAADASLLHYLREGWRRGLKPHPLFDPLWYLEQYPDVQSAGMEPLTHYVLTGAREGRHPSPWFDAPHYMAVRGVGLAPGANPLVDYLEGGAWRIGEPRPGFPNAAYIAARPHDLVRGMTPLEHWARGGRAD
ncbi:MAG: hypothetical protein Q8R27_12615 [Phenylobacterium sp.]|nr:hypothetical protein [Phenylobacterium sp.]